MMRFRSSYAKTLWFECPAEVLWDIENGRTATKAMETGSLVDQILTGERNYHAVSAPDWRTKAAREERDAARARGQLPVLEKDLDAAEETAGIVRAELLMMGVDLDSPEVIVQRELEWEDALGRPQRGTPDAFFVLGGRAITIDLKIGDKVSPDDMERMTWSMCWDVQAAQYQEGVCAVMGCQPGEHWLIRGSTRRGKCVTKCPLDEEFMELGRDRLEWCRSVFVRCVETNEWPEHEGRPLVPHGWMKAAVERRLLENGVT